MSVWAEDEDLLPCIRRRHAVWFAAVRAAGEAIFRNSAKMRIELRDEWACDHRHGHPARGGMDLRRRRGNSHAGPVFMTNIFLRAARLAAAGASRLAPADGPAGQCRSGCAALTWRGATAVSTPSAAPACVIGHITVRDQAK